ncbi:MAG: Rieske 2Fe-2S domain-containing protein, partial [Pseudomonadota bacterium]
MDTVLASQLGLDVAAIDAQLNENRGLPIHMYRDLPIFNFELDAIFHRSWQYLCPVEKLADPGSVVTDTLGKIPIVVTRAHDGQLHGLINSCRHRGYRVVEADAKECKVLRCRYHT